MQEILWKLPVWKWLGWRSGNNQPPATEHSPSRERRQGRSWASTRVGALCLILGAIAATGCQGRSDVAPSAPGPTPTAQSTPQPTPTQAEAEPTPPQSTPDPAPEPTQPTSDTAAAPNTVGTNTAPLPDTLVQKWEPLSNVLYEFGAMTVTRGEISWASGQTSAYSVVSTEGGYLLKLDAAPNFYDTPHPYIKFIPQTDASGTVTEVEVAFYENEETVASNEYVMFGTYFK